MRNGKGEGKRVSKSRKECLNKGERKVQVGEKGMRQGGRGRRETGQRERGERDKEKQVLHRQERRKRF